MKKKHYTIDSLFYNISDSSIHSLIDAHKNESFFKKNIRYSTQSIENERRRIFNLLINNGYFYFSIESVLFKIDTHTLKSNKIIVIVEILKNKKSPLVSKKITIDSVSFIEFTDDKQWDPKHSFYKGIYFEANTRTKTLISKILIKPHQMYRYQNNFFTQQNFSRIDIYKSVNFKFDTTHSKNSVTIYAEKLKKYNTKVEGGINLIQGLLGPFGSVSFKARNLLRRLDILEISAQGLFDGLFPVIYDADNVYRNFEYGANINISFPEILFISKIVPKNIQYKNTHTQFSGGYSVLDRFITRERTYKSDALNASFLYGLENNDELTNKKQKYSINILQGSLLGYQVSEAFQQDIDSFPVLKNSINSSFITNSGISMQSVQSKNIKGRIHNTSYNIFLEIAYSLDYLGIKKIIGEDKQSFQYVRLGIDYKKSIIFHKGITLAYRFNSGIILNYNGKSTGVDIPYTKHFFVGGSNGIRAWYPRRLGPGSNPDTSITERPGNILLEGSIEMRQKIINILEWAPFIDFGNVWLSEKDNERDNADFKVNRFLTEIAVGGGIGLRFNLSFLLIRLDYAFKLYDPSKTPSEKWIFEFYNRYKLADISLLHFAIGYSF